MKYRLIEDFKSLRCPLYQGNSCLMELCPAWEFVITEGEIIDEMGDKEPSKYRFGGMVEFELVYRCQVDEYARQTVTGFVEKTGNTVPGARWRIRNTHARCRVLMPSGDE